MVEDRSPQSTQRPGRRTVESAARPEVVQESCRGQGLQQVGTGGAGAGLHKASILCILDTRQIDPDKTASIQKNNKTSWAEGPARIK